MADGHPGLLRRFASEGHDGGYLLFGERLGPAGPGLVAQELDDPRLQFTWVLLEGHQAVLLLHPALALVTDAGRMKPQPGGDFWIAAASTRFESESGTLSELLWCRAVRFKPIQDAADGWLKGQFRWKSERRHGDRITRFGDLHLASFAPSYAFRRCCTSRPGLSGVEARSHGPRLVAWRLKPTGGPGGRRGGKGGAGSDRL
jgi:hypothetical protein